MVWSMCAVSSPSLTHPFVCHVIDICLIKITLVFGFVLPLCFHIGKNRNEIKWKEKFKTSVSGDLQEEGNTVSPFFIQRLNLLKHNNGQAVNALSFLLQSPKCTRF